MSRSHHRVSSLLASTGIALAVATLGCAVDRNGLGGEAGTTAVLVGAGGDRAGTGGVVGPVADGGIDRGVMGSGGASGAGSGTGGNGTGGSVGSGGAGSGAGGDIGSGGAGSGTGGGAGSGGAGSGTGGDVGSGGAGSGTGGSGAGGMPGSGGAFTGTGGHSGSGGSTSNDGGGPDVPPVAAGCADGTREAFTDASRFPSIAACAGGWSVAGLVTSASMAPACARAAGNDGRNPTGVGCTVEDLCADGWHVCRGASELTALGVTCAEAGIAPATGTSGDLFFATRQRGTAPTGCSPDATTGTNNLHGCGNFGRVEDPGCAPPLDRQIEGMTCSSNPPWSCSDPSGTMTEATVVTKSGSALGGVLCCR